MTYPSFELLRRQSIESLGVHVEEYRHTKTAAQHIHIEANNSENAFLVALRTVPHDSTGVAHILEHTALCGSKRYPVRDPFFMMIRRSLNTFMNAFTSSDWTAYPFASVNRKDFDNLLDVYLDAVFFPILDPLDFSQEGHRLEFKEMENSDSELEFKGVVFNEMKGAMSSDNSVLWQTLSKYVFPSNTYHFNSGGDPEAIPDLAYDDFVEFHRTHYHPSNAIFMTFGDIPAEQHQQVFENRVLSQFDLLEEQISVPLEKRYLAPVRVEEAYAVDANDSTENKAHVVVGWLLGESSNLYESMKANLLSSVLFDNSASPLQKALETSDLGKAPSPLCGLEDSQREMIFAAGLEGCEAANSEQIEQLVVDVLERVAEHGIELEQVQACLHQIELSQREITGDGFPYGLNLILTSLNSATHRGDPIALLDLDPVLKQLHQEIQDPQFIPNLCRELLLENPHRVRLTLRPDPELDQRRQQAEKDRLANINQQLDDQQKQQIIELSKALQQRQEQEDDAEILPKVTLDDVQPEMNYSAVDSVIDKPVKISRYAAGTNGLVYQQIVSELPQLSGEELEILPLLTHLMTEVGVGEKDYLATQNWQASVCGNIRVSHSIRGNVDDPLQTRGFLTLSSKALLRNQAEVCDLMDQTFEQARFNETQRLQEIVSQSRMSAQNSITGSGHALAMRAAAQNFSPVAHLGHVSSGLEGISRLIRLDDELQAESALGSLSERLTALHKKLVSMPRELVLITEAEQIEANSDRWSSGKTALESREELSTLSLDPSSMQPANQLWATRSQVNFCSKAYPTVPMNHADAPVLTALGGYLRNNYLHRAIREQGGAYGGGASQENDQAAFRFYSYRDPRLEETLDDFDKSIEWLAENSPPESLVEEAVLGVISSIDKPGSPAGEAKQTFHAELHGRTRSIREQFRNRTLAITGDDLQRVAATYLRPEQASTAVITDSSRTEKAESLNLSVQNLKG